MPDDQGQEQGQQRSGHTFEEHNKGPLPPLGSLTRDFDPHSGHSYFKPDDQPTTKMQIPSKDDPWNKSTEYLPVVPMSHNAVEKGTDKPVAKKPNVPPGAPGSDLPVGDPNKGLLKGNR